MKFEKAKLVRTKDWLGAHIGHVTASEVACFYGKGFKTFGEYVERKKDELANGVQPQERNYLFDMGHALEPLIADIFLEHHPELEMVKGFEKDKLFESKEVPLFRCTPDRIFRDKETGELVNVELKYDSTGKYYYNSPEDCFLNEGYLLQHQFQDGCLGIRRGFLAWISNYGRFSQMPIKASDVIWNDMKTRVPDMYDRYIIGNEELPILDVKSAQIARIEHKPITATEEIYRAVERMKLLEMQVKTLQNNLRYNDKVDGFEALKDKVRIFMGHNDQLLDEDGNELATYKGDKTRQFKLK